jgi:hypothetical protein
MRRREWTEAYNDFFKVCLCLCVCRILSCLCVHMCVCVGGWVGGCVCGWVGERSRTAG